ncbi:MAG: hypothetical protein QHH75_14100 [Bacillota bacterium]|nr:hypothetical protein [Bacillota bacterium]
MKLDNTGGADGAKTGFQPTYEGLKHEHVRFDNAEQASFQPTY